MNITNYNSNLTPSRNEKSLPKSVYQKSVHHVFDKAQAKRKNLQGGVSEYSAHIYFPYTPAATAF